jgi:hypothetical protein
VAHYLEMIGLRSNLIAIGLEINFYGLKLIKSYGLLELIPKA